MIKLTECGAVEGQPADNALRTALDHVANGSDSTIFWDGQFKITSEVRKGFLTTKGKHLNILGDGARSKILPSFPVNQHGIVLQNLETLTIKNLAIVGNGRHEFDCGNLFYLSSIRQIVWDCAHIYGLASPAVNYFGLVFIDNCSLNMSRSLFSGSTSVGAGLITIKAFRRVRITSVDVIDYGEIAGGTEPHGTFHSKTSLGFTHSWFRFTDPHKIGTTAYLGIPMLETIKLDEGARYGIACEGKVFSPDDNWVRGIRLRDVGINLRHAGIYLNRVESVVAEDSLFTWRGGLAIEGTDVKRTRLIRCNADKPEIDIKIEGRYDDLLAEDCYGFRNIIVPGTFRTVRNGKGL